MNTTTRPPFLRRVRIRGYKSIAFCDVTLDPLTVLVGRNASGKSNFVDALAFLTDAVDSGLDNALNAHGGKSLFHRPSESNRLLFEIESEFPSYYGRCIAKYTVEMALSARNQLEVASETLRLTDATRGASCGFESVRGEVSSFGLEQFQDSGITRHDPDATHEDSGDTSNHLCLPARYRQDRLLLSTIGRQPFLDFSEPIARSGYYSFEPNSIREPQPNSGSPFLVRSGANLARAIDGLREIDPESIERVKSYFSVIVDEVEDFDRIEFGDSETIRFAMRTANGAPKQDLNAKSMSDGTLRALAALVAAFQISIPFDHGLIAIEEPETSLHPAAMRALVDAIDEATLRTQILLTTHSAEILDHPTIQPEVLRIVKMVDGQTVIAPIDSASIEIARQNLNTLGGLERNESLEPSVEDVKRQRRLAETAA